jgi:site-specific recombinase XerD
MKRKNDIKRMKVVTFASKMGLPSTFQHLDIMGLSKVVTSEEIKQRNKELIFRFLNHISPEVGERRLTFYTHKLRRLGCLLKKDFDQVTEEDLRSLVTFLSKGKAREDGGMYSKGTIHGYKVTLKRFYKWLEGKDEEYPCKVRWIKTGGDTTRIKETEELLTFDEIQEMIRHAKNPRDKAMVSFLYESGARVSEMLSMKIKHIVYKSERILKAALPVSKTKPRFLALVACKEHLDIWMNYHPLKDDPEAPLWSNLKGDGRNPLLNQTVNEILKAMASAAGIKKRVYPHIFRACSITHKAKKGYPEEFIKEHHGLCKDSKVMKHYLHICYNDLEDIQRQMHGLPIENSNDLIQGIKCASCGKKNPLYVQICECGLPTEVKNVLEGSTLSESEIRSRVEKIIDESIEKRSLHDQMMERFLAALKEKSKHSPEILRAVNDIGREIQRNVSR